MLFDLNLLEHLGEGNLLLGRLGFYFIERCLIFFAPVLPNPDHIIIDFKAQEHFKQSLSVEEFGLTCKTDILRDLLTAWVILWEGSLVLQIFSASEHTTEMAIL